MEVKVQVDLSVPAREEHLGVMRSAANILTDDPESIRLSVLPGKPQAMLAEFTMLKARQMDVVDKIMREFAMFMQDYNDQTVWFQKRPKQRKKRSPTKPCSLLVPRSGTKN